MYTIHSSNIKEIWENSIEEVFNSGHNTDKIQDNNSIGTYFGKTQRSTLECLGFSIRCSNIRHRILYSDIRLLNYGYLLANFLFLFKRDRSVSFISFYNRHGILFTDDGENLNASFGYRIFAESNQLEQIKSLILKDKMTRRAIIQIHKKEDLFVETKDFPCANYFQILIRDEKLHFIVNMRSQSAFAILPYDFFLFSMFHEALACYLGYAVGEYIHFSGSFHIYNDEIEKANDVLKRKNSLSLEMKKMQTFNSETLQEIFRAEEDIRCQIQQNKNHTINYSKYNLDVYWQNFLNALFRAYLSPTNGIDNLKDICESSNGILHHEHMFSA